MKLGRHHPLLQRLRALRRDGARRRQEGRLVAEGIHLAAEALRADVALELAVHSPALADGDEGRRLLDQLAQRQVPLYEVTPAQLDTLQDARSPQPLLTLVRWRPALPEELLARCGDRDRVVVLHGVQDPGNLGSILRSADAAGAAALFVSGESADLTHPRTVRATMGSIFRLPTARADVGSLLAALKERDFRTVGSSPSAMAVYTAADWTPPLALFLGGEGAGLPGSIAGQLDGIVRIPMRGAVESLSVGAAAAVLLFEALRDR